MSNESLDMQILDRKGAGEYAKQKLNEHGLKEWRVTITNDPNTPYLGLCVYKDKTIILNAFHIDIHPAKEIRNTVLHEVAHALCPGHAHDNVWATKAREIGCDNTNPCSHLSLPEHVIDAIRSGHMVEVEVEEKEVVQVVREVKHRVTRLQDKCPFCGKVAVEKFTVNTLDKEGNDVKLITLECFHIIKKVIPRGTAFDTMVSNDWKPEVKNCKHTWDKNRCSKCGEFKLFNFQVAGARFAEAGLAVQKGVGIFDEMGLGKTIQALALLRFHADKYTPTMIVTKSAIKFQWFKAAVTWLGPSFIGQIISTGKDFFMPGLKVYIIPYDLLRRFSPEKKKQLHALGIKLVILDEVQQIKNPDSSRTQEVRKLVTGSGQDCKVVELSGTPWKNRGSEFFPALNLLDPIKFHSYQHYLDTHVDYYWDGAKKKMGGIRNIPRFKQLTETLVIRREYNEVMEEFPEVNRMRLPVQLDELSQSNYDDSESDFVKWYNDAVIGGEEDKLSGIEILAQMARMRHITGLAKIPATLSFIEEFVEDTDKKLVVFVHHKDVGQFMAKMLVDTNKETNPDWHELATTLKEEGVRVFSYTSAHTGRPEGYQIQEDFNNTKRCIMIASTLACGEGLNLQTCSDSILHERQWNPQNEDQATPGRFKRIGQVATSINITLPEADGTIDQHLDAIVETKRRFFHAAHNKGEVPTWSENDIAKQLAQLIVQKHQEKKKKSGKTETKTNITKAASF